MMTADNRGHDLPFGSAIRRATRLRLCLSVLACAVCAALEGPPPTLNPRAYTSSSGSFALTVNPTDLLGRGPADYRLTREGEPVWTNRLPYTLWEAVVADSGRVAGYAYTHGWRGFSEGGYKAGWGEFIVALLSESGQVVRLTTETRMESLRMDTPPNPLAKGLELREETNRFVVRLADPDVNERGERWRVFNLETGEQIAEIQPEAPETAGCVYQHIRGARAVPGTPLMLAHWWRYEAGGSGAIFSLIGLEGAAVWSVRLDADYDAPTDEERDQIRNMIWKRGAILSTTRPGMFDLLFFKDRARVSFDITPGGNDTWQVREVARAPWTPEPEPPAAPELALLRLKKVGTFALALARRKPTNAIRSIVGFDFDADGRICALRAGSKTPPTLLLVSQEGELIREVALPVETIPEHVAYASPAPLGSGRFVVAMSSRAIDGQTQCFIADFEAGTVSNLAVECPPIMALAGPEDGRFAALTIRRQRHSLMDGLYFFGADGRRLWRKEKQGYSGRPDDLLSPEDITRHGSNAIAVLDNVRRTIQIFDTSGALVRFMDLDDVWGRRPNYPTDIAADHPEGFVVYDFQATNPVVRVDAEGRIREELAPRFNDGRPFRVTDGVKCSPRGELWTSDGDALLRLSSRGTVDRILGEGLQMTELTSPGFVTVGPQDRVYVADKRTKTVHVFDATGARVGACIPSPEDVSDISSVRHVAVSPSGDIYVQLGFTPAYLHFDKDFARRCWAKVEVDRISQDWYFAPSNDLCWITGYHDVFLVKGLRDVIRTVSRHADGRWLEAPRQLELAPDGSMAILANTSQGNELSVSTYGPTGDPRATFSIPPAWRFRAHLAFDGRHVYVRQGSEVVMFDETGRGLGRFDLPSGEAENSWHGPFLAGEGKEVWFINGLDWTVHRYATAWSE